MTNTCSIILAAGEGTRMKSEKPKVLSEVLFKPMINWVIEAVEKSAINDICIITGFKHEMLCSYLNFIGKNYQTALQPERKGTAHAVMMASDFLNKNHGKDILILNGDSPFIDSSTLQNSLKLHREKGNSATVISAKIENPFGYGRIVRDNIGRLISITEQKDASDEIKKIKEVNSGAYWFKVDSLLDVLYDIKSDNAQNELYLPDAIKLLISKGLNVGSFMSDSEYTVLGANDCLQLNELNEIARKIVLNKLMTNGVDIPCTDGVIISAEAEFGKAVRILPNTIIKGNCYVGNHCTIGPNSYIENSFICDDNILISIYCINKKIEQKTALFPFSIL